MVDDVQHLNKIDYVCLVLITNMYAQAKENGQTSYAYYRENC